MKLISKDIFFNFIIDAAIWQLVGLNFIEFFWGLVKKYLRDNCDYTFDTLKENMPKALASVKLVTIRRWEHRMRRWMEAYPSAKTLKPCDLLM